MDASESVCVCVCVCVCSVCENAHSLACIIIMQKHTDIEVKIQLRSYIITSVHIITSVDVI